MNERMAVCSFVSNTSERKYIRYIAIESGNNAAAVATQCPVALEMINEHFEFFAISYGMFHEQRRLCEGVVHGSKWWYRLLKNMDAVNPLYMWLSILCSSSDSVRSCSTFIISNELEYDVCME